MYITSNVKTHESSNDKVPHHRLLRKLEDYGVAGRLLAWVKGWLLNRWQRVGVGALVGLEKGVEWNPSGIGVGSGSVSGLY